MRIFTARAWKRHTVDQREALQAARNSKPTDYQREQLKRYRKVIRELWEKHSKPFPDGEPGDSRFGQTWWCSECRTPWPCRTVRAVFAAEGFEYDYAPLRLAIRGEKRLKDAVELGTGHWMRVDGVEPDTAVTCGVAGPTAGWTSGPCELAQGHVGAHRNGPVEWAQSCGIARTTDPEVSK